MSSGSTSLRRVAATALAVVVVACGTDPGSAITAAPEPPGAAPAAVGGVPGTDAADALQEVAGGNARAVAAAPTLVPPGAPLPPFVEARLYAIANVAMHDALNAIVPRFQRYADTGPVDRQAAIAVAVLTAARDAIAGAAPGSVAGTDAWYATALAPYAGAPGYAAGVALGQRVAAAVLAARAGDNTAGGGVAPYTPGANPGDYRFTFPFNTPGFDFFGTGGFADASEWGSVVAPFVVASNAQFRAAPPYGAPSNAAAVQTSRYTTDYAEVASLGCAGCTARSATQTEAALFWMENSPTGWNRIAREVVAQRRLDAWESARLLALVAMAEFDSYSTSLETKYHYDFWRPVTAVALAASDGNTATAPVTGWEVLAFPTPPAPDYPSAHASAGGAAAAVIEALVPGRGPHITTTSTSLPGVARTFDSVADAALENALSRIWIGYHFRHAAEVGLAQGRAVGTWVATHALAPLP